MYLMYLMRLLNILYSLHPYSQDTYSPVAAHALLPVAMLTLLPLVLIALIIFVRLVIIVRSFSSPSQAPKMTAHFQMWWVYLLVFVHIARAHRA